MAKPLIIVESPTKTKSFKSFLGNKYEVEASVGHIRDLPAYRLGVDVEHDFTPSYEVMKDKKTIVEKLKKMAKAASEVYLASDGDREGEAIAWHLSELLGLEKAKRITYNEVTKAAVEAAIQNPRTIDQDLVEAQEARRILDRLVGYRLSPLLSSKIRSKLSAGRVQSVVVRMICEREREIQAFVPVEYWSLTAQLTPQPPEKRFPFNAKYVGLGTEKAELSNEALTQAVVDAVREATYTVRAVKQQERKRNAQPPFITSTLQQEASRKLGFTSKRTMALAQQLYEGVETDGEHAGLITYMRSDSTRVSNEAQTEAREFITERYGAAFAPAKPNVYKTKGSAQDAHECIRPTSVNRTPESLSGQLTPEQLKLYRLIWQRFVASQMSPAVFDVTTADIDAAGHTFRATGSVPKFEGFMKVYSEGKDTEEKSDEEQEPLPVLKVGQVLDLLGLDPKQHFTEPPPRYTEATLVKTLAEKELGRPSTYATFISTIIDRGYAELKERKFYPTELGFTTNDLLVANFPEILDVGFTVDMEKKLDGVGEGEVNKVALLKEFYGPFDVQVNQAFDKVESLKPKAVETDYTCPNCGKPMVLRQGPRGPFLGCTGYPKCKTLLNVDEEGKPVEQESNITEHACPLCGKPMMKREGKRGPFLGCTGYPKCKGVVDLNESGEPIADSLVVADKPCEKCGKPMIRRMGKRGPFLGCTGYPKCRNIIDLPGEEGAAGVEGEVGEGAAAEMTCPNCGKPMAKKFAGRRPFMGCTGYPECKTTLSMTGAPMEARAKEEPQLTEYKCPNCGEPLALRKGRFGPFLGCTGYPKCKTIVKVGKDGKPVGLGDD